MGNAKFYYTPEPFGSSARLTTIDLGEALGEMYSDISVEAVDAVSLNGSIQRSVGKTQEVVTIQRDRMLGGEDLAIQFHALQNHLDRGFSVSFSSDSTNAFCFPIRGSLSNGSTSINLYANPFANFTGISAIPASGDYCTIETSSPAMIQEIIKVDNASAVTAQGGTITTVDLVKFQYDQPAFLRHYRFYPVLKRPQADIGQSVITNEGGRLFSLSIRLVVDYEVLYSAHPERIGDSGVSFGRSLASATTAGRQGAGISLDGMPHFAREIGSGLGALEFASPSNPQLRKIGN